MNMRTLASGVALAAMTAFGAHAATTTFAGFAQTTSATDFQWTETGTGGTVSVVNDPIEFTISSGPYAGQSFGATLNLSGMSTTDASGGAYPAQGGIAGNFTITADAGAMVGGMAVPTNVLTGTYTGAAITSGVAGNNLFSDGFQAAVSSVSYSSDFTSIDLPVGTPAMDGFSFSLANLTQPIALNGSYVGSFDATVSGQFTSGAGTLPGGSGAPEPASWAMMLLGVGLVGGTLRRSRRASVAV